MSAYKPVKLCGKDGTPIAWVTARFILSSDRLTGYWETPEQVSDVVKALWASNGLVELKEVGNAG